MCSGDIGGNAQIQRKKVSVILPVYNVEKYLDRCMKSLTDQSLPDKDYEVILVDDGSKDSSGEKCDEYSKQSANIIVIHQENKGAAAARNAGLKVAHGEYVFFVDPDDYVERDYLETGVKCAAENDADIAVFDAFREMGESVTNWNHASSSFSTDVAEDILSMRCQILYPYMAANLAGQKGVRFSRDIPLSAPWDKCYRRQFLVDNGLKFPEELKVLDDMTFNFEAFGKTGKIAYINKTTYHYSIEQGSITNSYKGNRPELDQETFRYLQDCLIKENVDAGTMEGEKLRQAYLARIIKSFAICCRLCFFNKNNPDSEKERLLRVKKYMSSAPYREAFREIRLNSIEWKLVAVVFAGRIRSPRILRALDRLQNK
ncbi:MAG: glycosyltransferase [Butyrivibrio sp.]|nr:glycosyltransferase [Butyrivibrio sp.]